MKKRVEEERSDEKGGIIRWREKKREREKNNKISNVRATVIVHIEQPRQHV